MPASLTARPLPMVSDPLLRLGVQERETLADKAPPSTPVLTERADFIADDRRGRGMSWSLVARAATGFGGVLRGLPRIPCGLPSILSRFLRLIITDPLRTTR